jgi:hypothetical protein
VFVDLLVVWQLLGLDIILTESLKPILLEVNHMPSFAMDSVLDKSIKSLLIAHTLSLLHVSPREQASYNQVQARQAQLRLYGDLFDASRRSDRKKSAAHSKEKPTSEPPLPFSTRASYWQHYLSQEQQYFTRRDMLDRSLAETVPRRYNFDCFDLIFPIASHSSQLTSDFVPVYMKILRCLAATPECGRNSSAVDREDEDEIDDIDEGDEGDEEVENDEETEKESEETDEEIEVEEEVEVEVEVEEEEEDKQGENCDENEFICGAVGTVAKGDDAHGFLYAHNEDREDAIEICEKYNAAHHRNNHDRCNEHDRHDVLANHTLHLLAAADDVNSPAGSPGDTLATVLQSIARLNDSVSQTIDRVDQCTTANMALSPPTSRVGRGGYPAVHRLLRQSEADNGVSSQQQQRSSEWNNDVVETISNNHTFFPRDTAGVTGIDQSLLAAQYQAYQRDYLARLQRSRNLALELQRDHESR